MQQIAKIYNAGFISSYLPYGNKKNGIYYRISDEYCYFYYKWILPIKNRLQQNPNIDYWQSIINTPAYYNWLRYAFENVYYKRLEQIKQSLKVGNSSLASPWQAKGAQIDLLFDRNDDAITICEIKYTDKPFPIYKKYAKDLTNKVNCFIETTKTKKQIFLALVLANGLKPTMYSEDLITGGLVTLADLYLD